jgi:excinuclease ABC subunit C
VPGLGRARRARLLGEFGSLRALRAASAEDLLGVTWLPDDVAGAVHAKLHPAAPGLHRRAPGAGPRVTP